MRRRQVSAPRKRAWESELVRGTAKDGLMTAYDHAKKSGLIGAAKGTICDLSTNKKHFDGFGRC